MIVWYRKIFSSPTHTQALSRARIYSRRRKMSSSWSDKWSEGWRNEKYFHNFNNEDFSLKNCNVTSSFLPSHYVMCSYLHVDYCVSHIHVWIFEEFAGREAWIKKEKICLKENSCIVWWSNFPSFDLLGNVFHMRFVKFYYAFLSSNESGIWKCLRVSNWVFFHNLFLLVVQNDDKIHCTRYELWISAESQHEKCT